MMKIVLAQLNYTIGDFEKNANKIISAIKKAKDKGAGLVVFSELSLCGYPPLDLLEHKSFIEKCTDYTGKIAAYCTDIAAIIGAPVLNTKPEGKNLFNSALFLINGRPEYIINKSLLPTYDIFDEYRHFEANREFNIIEYNNYRIAITICEDLWYDQPILTGFGKNKLYSVSPVKELIEQKPDFIINIAASPFAYTYENIKKEILVNNARDNNIPIIYLNQIGANTELIFAGDSLIISNNGTIIDKLKSFEEDINVYDIDEIINYKGPGTGFREAPVIEKIHNALITGIKDYFKKLDFQTATLGLSGGIDSAVTLVLAVKALGSENVRVLLMPSKYSSEHSVTDAVQLANNLKVKYDIINIDNVAEQFGISLKPVFYNLPPDITEENIQARIRGNLLMALSNKFGNILLNTSNKSEAAVGYSTLYGDLSGGLSVLGDVYKTDVYRLADYINKEMEIIPGNIIEKAPSAELRPDQKDTDSLPEYDILDKILMNYIELQKSDKEIIQMGINKDIVQRVIKMVNSSEYKRYQTPPILRISSKAFGFGRRMPLAAKY
jgi:NAD+ synthase (glutamine-hydrolysing)